MSAVGAFALPWSVRLRIGSWVLALVATATAGCECGAPMTPELDASETDAETDAADVGSDAGFGGCGSRGTTAWSLETAVLSTDFAPRGVSGAEAVVYGLSPHGTDVYLAGSFEHAGPVAAASVAVWSASEGYRALGPGLPGRTVLSILPIDGGALAVSLGVSTRTGDLFVFDGSDWSMVASADLPIYPPVRDVDGSVLVAGAFTTIGGVDAGGLARWDGSTFVAIDAPRANLGPVLADAQGLCVVAREAAAAFVLCRAPGETTWTEDALPSMTSVASLVRDTDGALLAAGSVLDASGTSTVGVLRREASGWVPLGEGPAGSVHAFLHAPDGAFVALGQIESSDGGASFVTAARWDGTSWGPLGSALPLRNGFYLGSFHYSAAVAGSDVVVAGPFLEAHDTGRISAPGLARWDGSRWRGLDHPGTPTRGLVGPTVFAPRSDCASVVVGGRFWAVGDVESEYVAVLDESGWSAWPAPPPAAPGLLAFGPDGTLYAGAFQDPTGEWPIPPPPPSDLMRFVGGSWEPITELATMRVRALAFGSEGTTYVAANDLVLALDGTHVSPVGARDPLPVSAMLATDAGLYVIEGNRLSLWDGATWRVVWADLPFAAHAIVEWRGEIIVAGTAGLARVHADWLEQILFPERESVDIVRLVVAADRLVAVGHRTDSAAGYRGVAQWVDAHGDWHDLAPDGPVDDVAVIDGALLLAGRFLTVGGVPSAGIARLQPP